MHNLIWSLSQPSITFIVSPPPPRQCQPVHTVCKQRKSVRLKLAWWSPRQLFWNLILSLPTVTNRQSDKCKDCAAGQCATHCYVLLLRWGCDKDKGGNHHSEISPLEKDSRHWNGFSLLLVTGWRMDTSMRKPKSRRWRGRFLRGLASLLVKRSPLPTLQALSTKWMISSLKLSRCVSTFKIIHPYMWGCCLFNNNKKKFNSCSLQSCNNRSGVSYQSVLKYIVKKYPGMELDKKKFLIKKAMKKHLEKGTIKQVNSRSIREELSVLFLPFNK